MITMHQLAWLLPMVAEAPSNPQLNLPFKQCLWLTNYMIKCVLETVDTLKRSPSYKFKDSFILLGPEFQEFLTCWLWCAKYFRLGYIVCGDWMSYQNLSLSEGWWGLVSLKHVCLQNFFMCWTLSLPCNEPLRLADYSNDHENYYSQTVNLTKVHLCNYCHAC